MNEYEKQANDFLKETGTEIKIKFLKYGYHFEDDTDKRDIYKITLKRGSREYTFNFGQSVYNSGFKLQHTKTKQEIKYRFIDEFNNEVRNMLFSTNIFNRHLKTQLERQKKIFKQLSEQKLGSLSYIEVINPTEPTIYDVLACLNAYEPEDFKDFCIEFGYDEDSRKAFKIYERVQEETKNLKMLFNDEELEKLLEIA